MAGQPPGYNQGQPQQGGYPQQQQGYPPQQQQPYGQPGYGPPQQQQGTPGLAIAGLILSIIPCTWPLGLIFAIIALVQSGNRNGAGKGMSIASICICGVWLVLGIIGQIAQHA